MATDDNQKLKQLLNVTTALISAMEAARRGNTETDRTSWYSFKPGFPRSNHLSWI